MKRCFFIFLLILCLLPLGGWAEEETAQALYPIRENGLWGYMNRAGEVVIEPQWDNADLFDRGVAVVSNNTGDHQEKVFLIDEKGQEIFDPAWEYLHGDIFVDPDTGKFGYYDRNTGFLQEPAYEELFSYGAVDEGFLFVAEYVGMEEENDCPVYGVIRKSDRKSIVPIAYDSLYDGIGFSEGFILVANDIHGRSSDSEYGPEYHLFDRNGTEILFPEGIMPYSLPHEGVLTIMRKLTDVEKTLHPSGWGQVFGLAKPDGTIVKEPCFDYVFSASNGMVCFFQDQRNGWMDLAGNVVIPPVYDLWSGGPLPEAQFYNDYLVLYDEATERFVLLDRSGTELYSVPREYSGIKYQFRWVMSNHCFWQSVTKDNVTRYQLMKIQNGQVLSITEPIFETVDISCFPDGFYWNDETKLADDPLPVRINGKCGFINAEGDIIISPGYDAVTPFYCGLALVEKDGKLMYIDHSGAVVWEER